MNEEKLVIGTTINKWTAVEHGHTWYVKGLNGIPMNFSGVVIKCLNSRKKVTNKTFLKGKLNDTYDVVESPKRDYTIEQTEPIEPNLHILKAFEMSRVIVPSNRYDEKEYKVYVTPGDVIKGEFYTGYKDILLADIVITKLSGEELKLYEVSHKLLKNLVFEELQKED